MTQSPKLAGGAGFTHGGHRARQGMTASPSASIASPALLTIELQVAEPMTIGDVGGALRRLVPIIGGTVSGRYAGTVLGGGADWQTIRADGAIEISARYVLDLTDGLVEVRSEGLRAGPPEVLERLAKGEGVDPSLYFFRTDIRFATAAPALVRLNSILGVSHGERIGGLVKLPIYEVI